MLSPASNVDGKSNDVDDDGVEGRLREWGLANWLGLSRPAVRHCLPDLWAESKRWSHHVKGIAHVWIGEYPKRASKLGAIMILRHWMAIGTLIWRPWA